MYKANLDIQRKVEEILQDPDTVNWIETIGSECKKFEVLDLQQEEKDRLDREKCNSIKLQLGQIKQESRARLKTIQSEFNMNNLFLK